MNHEDAKTRRYDGTSKARLRPYPGPGEQIPVSAGGGTEPEWSPKGDELFFRSGERMVVTPLKTSNGAELGEAHVLFEGPFSKDPSSTRATPNYDVARDGKRFLMVSAGITSSPITTLSVVLNWHEELKQRAPAR